MTIPSATDFKFMNLQRNKVDINSLTAKVSKNSAKTDERFNRDLSDVAKKFEAIFVKMILTEARKSSQESELFEKTVVGTFNKDLYDTKMSEFIAEKGGFGIGKLVYEKYKRTAQETQKPSDKHK